MSLFCLSGCQGGSGERDVRGGARTRVIKTNRMSQGRKNIPLKFMFYFSTSIDNILITREIGLDSNDLRNESKDLRCETDDQVYFWSERFASHKKEEESEKEMR